MTDKQQIEIDWDSLLDIRVRSKSWTSLRAKSSRRRNW